MPNQFHPAETDQLLAEIREYLVNDGEIHDREQIDEVGDVIDDPEAEPQDVRGLDDEQIAYLLLFARLGRTYWQGSVCDMLSDD